MRRPGGGDPSAAELRTGLAGGRRRLSLLGSVAAGPSPPPRRLPCLRRAPQPAAGSGRPLAAPASRAPAPGRAMPRARPAVRPRRGRILRGWRAGTPPGRDGHPRRRRPPPGRGLGKLHLAAEGPGARWGWRGAPLRVPARLGRPLRCLLAAGGLGPVEFSEKGESNGALGTCQERARPPAWEAAPGAPRRGGRRGRGLRGALRPPLGGAQPAALTFPRGGPGRAVHGISRAVVSL